MHSKKFRFALSLALLLALGQARPLLQAQNSVAASDSTLPDAPTPMLLAQAGQPGAEAVPQDGPAQQSSSTRSDTKDRRQLAEEQLKEQTQQRTLGIFPAFGISYRGDAVSLTSREKMKLAFRGAVDPMQFVQTALMTGLREANGADRGFGWGPEGFGKRYGASYMDSFDGAIIGNGILPSLLRQDPRYFRLGHGTVTHRLLYAMASTVICKHDTTHKWEPNYSNVAGNLASGAISNLYYPDSDSGAGRTVTNGIVVSLTGGVGSVFQEFWPDISRKFLHKDPTHGLDAQAAAQQKK